ncbi:MAG: cell surface protein SprA [Porphyromonas sp.]|nr:cell surface protein SprA [Porphyromonas sp.]
MWSGRGYNRWKRLIRRITWAFVALFCTSLSLTAQTDTIVARTIKSKFYIRPLGNAGVATGLKTIENLNPTLPLHLRKRRVFAFDNNLDLILEAGIKDRVKLQVGFNNNSPIASKQRLLKLRYMGLENDPLKILDAGYFDFRSENPLILPMGNLVGLRSVWDIGALEIEAFASRQEGENRKIQRENASQERHSFSLRALDYDLRKHFFIAPLFRELFSETVRSIPMLSPTYVVEDVEVWVTNRYSSTEEVRDIVAFTPESSKMSSSLLEMYKERLQRKSVEEVEEILSSESEYSFAVIRNARRLMRSEYSFHPELGILSLKSPLAPEDLLAVSFRYRSPDEDGEVGQHSIASANNSSVIVAQLLSAWDKSPNHPTSSLMLRNIYTLAPGGGIEPDKIKVDLMVRPHGENVESRFIGQMSLATLLRLDFVRPDGTQGTDGIPDLIPNISYLKEMGALIFPLLEPFGKDLEQLSGEASSYAYHALYDSTLTVAKQQKDKDRFFIRGYYERSGGMGEILLGATNIPQGSVTVTAGGRQLIEHKDYTVDYLSGVVRITNPLLLEAQLPIEVNIDDPAQRFRKKKDLIGLEARWTPLKGLTLNTSLLHYGEESALPRTYLGQEEVENRMFGGAFRYDTSLPKIHAWIERISNRTHETPSQLSLQGSYAKLWSRLKGKNGEVIIDDFDTPTPYMDLSYPEAWHLGSSPLLRDDSFDPVKQNYSRSHLSWYRIDPMLQYEWRESGYPMPKGSSSSLFHLQREVSMNELFPSRHAEMLASYLPVLNISFYPKERGAYNLNPDAFLPKAQWGSMLQRLPRSDFEEENIEYMEFWIMDPYLEISTKDHSSGVLIIDLGQISEDILGDGTIGAENLLPTSENPHRPFVTTVWGRSGVGRIQTRAFNFENPNDVKAQDVGLNGLSSQEETAHPLYASFLQAWKSSLSEHEIQDQLLYPFSRLHSPSGDKYISPLDPFWQTLPQVSLLFRHKYINGMEGNSQPGYDPSGRALAATLNPDSKDLDGNQSLLSRESFFRYTIPLSRQALSSGGEYVDSFVETDVTLPNGSKESVRWYKIKIPLKSYSELFGNISNFRHIPFVRLSLTGFEEDLHLRLTGWKLSQSDWRAASPLSDAGALSSSSVIAVGSVSIEEDAGRIPVNYVSPPGIRREREEGLHSAYIPDERALTLQVKGLESGAINGIYRTLSADLRDYERMTLFTHAENLKDALAQAGDGDIRLSFRIGDDHSENYYEYEIPLSVTSPGKYGNNSSSDREAVWPQANYVDILLSEWTELKAERNDAILLNSASLDLPYGKQKGKATYRVKGNPNLANIRTVFVGLVNASSSPKSIELWCNQWSLKGSAFSSGSSAELDGSVTLGDIGTLSFRTRERTPGFGQIDAAYSQRDRNLRKEKEWSANLQIGELFPASWRLSVPLFIRQNKSTAMPEYDPLQGDIRTDNHSDNCSSEKMLLTTISAPNLSWQLKSRTPMPYDPANVRFSFFLQRQTAENALSLFDNREHAKLSLEYDYISPRKSLTSLALQPWPTRLFYKNSMERLYGEQQERKRLQAEPPIRLSHKWDWMQDFKLEWQLSPRLFWKWESGHKALVREPYLRVNRHFAKADYDVWRDSVLHEIKQWGDPSMYTTAIELAYTLPLQEIKALKRALNGSLRHTGFTSWQRGTRSGKLASGHQLSGNARTELSLSLSAELLYKALFPKDEVSWGRGGASKTFSWSMLPYSIRGVVFHKQWQSSSLFPHLKPKVGGLLGEQLKDEEGNKTSIFTYLLGLQHGSAFGNELLQRGNILQGIGHNSPSVFFHREEQTLTMRLSPWRGLSIDLLTHTAFDAKQELYTQEKVPNLRRYATTQTSSIFFLKPHSIPAWLSTPFSMYPLPSWDVRWQLPLQSSSKWLQRLSLRHSYRALSTRSDADTRSYPATADLPALSPERYEVKVHFFPLIGVDLSLLKGLTCGMQYNTGRGYLYWASSGRVIESEQNELQLSLDYKISGLNWIPMRLISFVGSHRQELSVHLSFRQTEKLSWTSLRKGDASSFLFSEPEPTQGMRSHTLKSSIEYALGRDYSVRIFYDRDFTTPLLSPVMFPTSLSYLGIMFKVAFR